MTDFPREWSEHEAEDKLLERLVGDEPEIADDHELQLYFHGAMMDREMPHDLRMIFYDNMLRYLWDEYQIDFENDFDWEAYKEWYDGTAAA